MAILVGQGLTNREIAVRLFISERTAESHVEQIRGKLGVRSRAQIAVWVAAGGLTGSGPPPASVSPARETPPPTLDRPQIRLQGRRAVIVSTALAGITVLALLAVWLSWLSAPHATQSLGTTVAGTGERAFSSDGGQATASSLVRPLAVAVGPSGEIYIAEDSRIREVNKDGRISTFAGTGTSGYSGDLAPAAQAQLNMPQGLAVDSAGNVYISDTLNDRVRRVDADGTITTVAGTGVAGYAGDGGPGREATLNLPTGLAIGFNDALFIADTGNNVVRQLGPDGIIRTVAGTGEAGYRGDGGPADYAVLHSPGGVAFDAEGNLYIVDSLNQRVRRVDVNGQIATVAGTGTAGYAGDGGPAVYAELHMATNPLEGMGQGLAVDSQGDVFIADATNHRVRRVDVSGNIRTVVQMDTPLGLAVDPRGAVYVADADDNRVRRVG